MPGCWTVRPLEKVQTATPFVVGTWAADFDVDLVMAAIEGKAIEPLTSIAWLFWHVGSQPGRAAEPTSSAVSTAADSGWTSPYIASHPIFTTAEEAVGAMRAGCRGLDAALRSSSDEERGGRCGSGDTADPARWAPAPR